MSRISKLAIVVVIFSKNHGVNYLTQVRFYLAYQHNVKVSTHRRRKLKQRLADSASCRYVISNQSRDLDAG